MSPSPEALLEHMAFVRSVARATLRGDDFVEDVVQDTMVTALGAAQRPRGPLRAWLAGVARNKARMLIRRRVARRRWEERAASMEATAGPDALVERAEEGRRLVAAVLTLDAPYREPILLRYYERLAPRKIAKRLGIPVETVRTRLKRGIVRLRAELGRSHGHEPGGWRAALLPLLQLPSRGPGLTSVLGTGGVMVVKKWTLWVVIILVLMGGALALRPGGDDQESSALDGDAALSTEAVNLDPATLRGRSASHAGQATTWPAPVDLGKVNRERDLHGVVVHTDGSPVAGASLEVRQYGWRGLGVAPDYARMLESTKGPTSVSGVDGSFTLRLKPGELVYLRVRASGLGTTEVAHLQAGERVRIVLSEPVRLIVVATAPSGQPAVGVPIRLFTNPMKTGTWIHVTATTGPDGRAVFEDLPPALACWLDPQPSAEGIGNPGWVKLALPRRGELIHRLALPPGKTLRGRVTDATTGKAIPGARVSSNWAFVPSVETNAKGEYEVHSWTESLGPVLHAVAPGYAPGLVEIGPTSTVDLRLRRGLRVLGRILDDTGRPVADARVALSSAMSGGGVPSLGGAKTDARGRFEVRRLTAAKHVLVATAGRAGRLTLTVSPSTSLDLGDLVLLRGFEITGTITDPAGIPLAREPVLVRATGRLSGSLRRIERFTDDLGRFRFPNLGPGTYDVLVGSRFEPTITRHVQLTSEEPGVDLVLSMAATRPVVVRAVDTLGRPVSGVHLQARRGQPQDWRRGATPTGEDGRTTLELLRRPYRLFVLGTPAQGFAIPAPTELDAVQTQVEVVIERLVAIRGRLVTPDDKPIGWGQITVKLAGSAEQRVLADAKGMFVAFVRADAQASLSFGGLVQDPRHRGWQFTPFAGSVSDIRAATHDLLLRTAPIDTSRELTIQVTSPDGRAVSGVLVTLRLPANGERSAVTGPDGRVRWTGLPALPVSPVLLSWRGASSDEPWIIPRLEQVTPHGQELTVRLRQGIPLEGRILKPDGSKASGAPIAILEDGRLVRHAVADANGNFVAILTPEFKGETTLRSRTIPSAEEPALEAVAVVRPGQGPVTLQLKPVAK